MSKNVLIVEDESVHAEWEGNEVKDLSRLLNEEVDVTNVDSL